MKSFLALAALAAIACASYSKTTVTPADIKAMSPEDLTKYIAEWELADAAALLTLAQENAVRIAKEKDDAAKAAVTGAEGSTIEGFSNAWSAWKDVEIVTGGVKRGSVSVWTAWARGTGADAKTDLQYVLQLDKTADMDNTAKAYILTSATSSSS